MSCPLVRRRLSAFIDGDLEAVEAGRVAAHLRSCEPCSAVHQSLRQTIDLVGRLPEVTGGETMAGRVLSRLEVEQRGLASIFRSKWATRPLMVPSLLPAAVVVVAVLGAVLAIDRSRYEDDWPVPRSGWDALVADSGTEDNPLSPSSDVRLPRASSEEIVDEAGYREKGGEGTFFLETVVARDGTVSAVTLLTGDTVQARPIVEALRRERFEPVRFRGRPVAVSVYRLISRLEVRPPRI
jgi:hypothetical protein